MTRNEKKVLAGCAGYVLIVLLANAVLLAAAVWVIRYVWTHS